MAYLKLPKTKNTLRLRKNDSPLIRPALVWLQCYFVEVTYVLICCPVLVSLLIVILKVGLKSVLLQKAFFRSIDSVWCTPNSHTRHVTTGYCNRSSIQSTLYSVLTGCQLLALDVTLDALLFNLVVSNLLVLVVTR